MALAPSFPLMAIVWTIAVNGAALTFSEETIEMNPPTDIKIVPGRLGAYVVSWSGNCMHKNNICYQLDYRYLDASGEEISHSKFVETHQKEIDLEYHRGLFAQVKLLHIDVHNLEISSNWTEAIFNLSRESFASIDNLSCIFYDDTYDDTYDNTYYMNCTWDINKRTPSDGQYFLSYREANEDAITDCANYHKDGQRNVACYALKYGSNLIEKVNICVSESSNKTKLPHCRNMSPGSFYKLYAPINVAINKSTDEVTWKLPNANYDPSCYTYQINITNWSDHVPKVENLTSAKYVISRDQKKGYSVQVRAIVNDDCFASNFWSDWSKPLNIGPDSKAVSLSTIAILVAVTFVVIVLILVFICLKFKLLTKVCQPIPDPKEKFRGLFEECDGDFQKWINKNPPLMTKTEDCFPVTVKEV